MKRLLIPLAAAAVASSAAALSGEQIGSPMLRCAFNAVRTIEQPERNIEVRLGSRLDGSEFSEDDEMVYLWVEDGVPVHPVWPTTMDGASAITVQSLTQAGVTNMITVRPDGQAVLSTHDTVRDPLEIVWSAALGHCVLDVAAP